MTTITIENPKINELKEICKKNHTVMINATDINSKNLDNILDVVIACSKKIEQRNYDDSSLHHANINYSVAI